METENINLGTDETSLLRKIQAYNFAAYDLGLYLNTHPYEKRTLDMHADVAAKLKEAENEYRERFGPLTAKDSSGGNAWRWNKNPWPWDGGKKEE